MNQEGLVATKLVNAVETLRRVISEYQQNYGYGTVSLFVAKVMDLKYTGTDDGSGEDFPSGLWAFLRLETDFV